ncbi:MAG: hypothetical protein ACJKTH_01810 [Patescibacteria group bacterium UBA2163]
MKKVLAVILMVVIGGALATLLNNGAEQQNVSVRSIDEVFFLSEQVGTEDTILIDRVIMEQPGFVVLREVVNEKPGQVIEASRYLERGEHANILIELTKPLPAVGVDISGEFPLTRNAVAVVYTDDGDKGFNPFLDSPAYYNGAVLARFVRTGAVAPEHVAVPNTGIGTNVIAQTVTYTDSGFSPQTVEVRRGDTVQFVNKSSRPMWVASNEHPAHTVLPTFDQFSVSAFGESYEYTFEQEGTWEYHDHVNASELGTVIVRN